mmetsp:Transcript_63050/g.119249  ORF Transcript_63050/g.119249 Transcript_63050/m.119249 type:complete len:110 (+) Transcript_63050:728-1057(+)
MPEACPPNAVHHPGRTSVLDGHKDTTPKKNSKGHAAKDSLNQTLVQLGNDLEPEETQPDTLWILHRRLEHTRNATAQAANAQEEEGQEAGHTAHDERGPCIVVCSSQLP